MTRGNDAEPTADPGETTQIRRVLCPVDVSDVSASVLAYAAAFAKLFGSEVTVLHVFATAVPPASSAAAKPGTAPVLRAHR